MKSMIGSLFNKKTLAVPVVVVLILGLVLAGCGGGTTPPPPPTTSNPPASTTPLSAMEFPVDKYTDTYLSSDGLLRISWKVTRDTVFIGIKAKTTGWVAIALSPTLNKHESDLIIGFVNGVQVTLIDSFDPGYNGNHPQDSAYGGTNDLQDISGSESNGVTTLEFSRYIDTHDSFDIALINGVNTFLFALGATDNTSDEHSVVGFGILTLSYDVNDHSP